jgi:hypothetical protein
MNDGLLVLRLIIASTSVLPLLIVAVLYLVRKLPRWVAAVYVMSFVVCAVGWEIWFTFGLWGGLPVNERRSPMMNIALPQAVNWINNSLVDAGPVCLLGLLFVWLIYRCRPTSFRKWHWGAFVVLLVWFVIQNICVDLFVLQGQLGFRLSWAPLTPAGPWFNPVLFTYNGHNVQLQTQVPWVLMTPIFYFIVLKCYRWLSGDVADAKTRYSP